MIIEVKTKKKKISIQIKNKKKGPSFAGKVRIFQVNTLWNLTLTVITIKHLSQWGRRTLPSSFSFLAQWD